MKLVYKISWAVVLILATLQALRIGYSDYLFRKDTLASVERAAQIWPGDADFHARLADLDSPNDIAHFRRAVALNPGLSKSWIALGLRLELGGHAEEAEGCYLEAARRDRQFLPAWTLANFYARRQDATRFWPWARQAAQMSYDGLRPLLRLAFGLTSSSEEVREKMIVPRRRVEHEFLQHLLEERLDGSSVAALILSKAGKEDLPPLLEWTDRLIETKRPSEARQLWDRLSDKGLIPYPHLTLLTNPDFSQEPLQAGFDWRITAPPGVNYARTDGGLRIELSGKQPEAFELASQYLDLPAGPYVLSFEYRTAGIVTTTNLRWRMGEVASEPFAAVENWTRGTLAINGRSGNRLILLEQRDPGTVRPEGVVYLRKLRLGPSNTISYFWLIIPS